MSSSPFPSRGVIEGFYGVYYTHPERLSLLEFMSRHGYNLYIYAPKNDRQHRSRWREPYREREMERFGETVRRASDLAIDFCYGLSPGVDISYSSGADFESITGKLGRFHDLGVHHFSLLLDDIRRSFPDPADARHYPSFAAAQADLCNRVFEWLLQMDPACTLSMCPTEYHGAPPFGEALFELGCLLRPEIDVFYTGLDVCSPTVDPAEVEAFARALRRLPLLWDNYPVNDLAMHGELHLGPLSGRSAGLAGSLRGILVNPMNQAEASKVPLATYADYLRDPQGYDPEASWRRALREVGGECHEALRLVAENSQWSCLGTPEAPRLEELCAAAKAELEAGSAQGPGCHELYDYLRELDEACYDLRNRNDNLALRNELLPWLEQLERWTWLGRWSIEALQAVERRELPDARLLRRIDEYLGLVDGHHKRIAGTFLRPLAELAQDLSRESQAA